MPPIKSIPGFLVPALFLAVLVTFLYGFLLPDEPGSHQAPGKPTTDFSFIRRFICISDLLGKEQWHENKGRSFDEEGVHLTNGKQHPVNACHYALYCYDEYTRTGDTALLNGFYAQVRYLMDPESYHEPDSGLVAYPYMIAFHDLKPPWYSALAQSEAISVLIRYYALTRDEKSLSLITRIRNFMIGPQEGGCGTMSVTPEGRRWYEEYPNSKQERQVLNGFYLSIVALYEYSRLFPDDDSARFHYEEAVQTAKSSFKYYDTGTWLKYNRGDGRQISNGYLKWIILETRLLYQITGDVYFKNVSMLLSSYSFNKSYDTPGSRLKDYDFSVPLDTGSGDQLVFKGKATKCELNKKNGEFSTSFGGTDAEMSKIYDAHVTTFAKFTLTDTNRKAEHHVTWKFRKHQWVESCSITFAGADSMLLPDVSVLYKDTVKSKHWQKLSSPEKSVRGKSVEFRFRKINATAVTFVFENLSSFREIRIADVSFYLPSEMVRSDYMHFITPVFVSDAGTVSLKLDYADMKDVVVFSKKADNAKALDQEKWNPLEVFRSKEVKVPSARGKHHRFLIVYEPKSVRATVRKPVLN